MDIRLLSPEEIRELCAGLAVKMEPMTADQRAALMFDVIDKYEHMLWLANDRARHLVAQIPSSSMFVETSWRGS